MTPEKIEKIEEIWSKFVGTPGFGVAPQVILELCKEMRQAERLEQGKEKMDSLNQLFDELVAKYPGRTFLVDPTKIEQGKTTSYRIWILPSGKKQHKMMPALFAENVCHLSQYATDKWTIEYMNELKI